MHSNFDERAFWNMYAYRVVTFLPPLTPNDGLPEEQILRAEQRLGLHLPGVLRHFYRLVGRRDDINQAFNQLLLPDDIFVVDGYLVFFRENQCVVVWGVRTAEMDEEDPAVYESEDEPMRAWSLDHRHLSDFLLSMLYWQAVNGGMSYSAIATVDQETLSVVRRHWQPVELPGTDLGNVRFFCRPGQLLCVCPEDDAFRLQVGAKTEQDLVSVREELHIEWGYSSLDDVE